MDDISKRKKKVRAKQKRAWRLLLECKSQQRDIEAEHVRLLKKRVRYDALIEVSTNLARLDALGASDLFWGGLGEERRGRDHLARVHNLVTEYESRLEASIQARQDIWNKIQVLNDKTSEYKEQGQVLLEVEEESRDEFVIDREPGGSLYRTSVMPWTVHGEDEKRFRKILLLILFLTILLGYLVPSWNITVVEREVKIEVPERLARLLLEKAPPPPPPKKEEVEEEKEEEEEPKPEKKEEKKEEIEKKPEPEQKPKPTKEKKPVKKKAQSAGVLAFKNDFAGLLDLDSDVDSKLGAKASLTNLGATAKKSTRSIITSQSTSGSGGINTAAISKNVGGTGSGLEGVGFSRVESTIGTEYATDDRPLSEGPGPSRTDEEIQIVFDKYKSALYRIYNRELRKNPTLQGKMVLRLTIEPDGKVSAASVESSDMDAPDLDKKIVARVKKFKFGAKEGVPTITILFPIDFLPAN